MREEDPWLARSRQLSDLRCEHARSFASGRSRGDGAGRRLQVRLSTRPFSRTAWMRPSRPRHVPAIGSSPSRRQTASSAKLARSAAWSAASSSRSTTGCRSRSRTSRELPSPRAATAGPTRDRAASRPGSTRRRRRPPRPRPRASAPGRVGEQREHRAVMAGVGIARVQQHRLLAQIGQRGGVGGGARMVAAHEDALAFPARSLAANARTSRHSSSAEPTSAGPRSRRKRPASLSATSCVVRRRRATPSSCSSRNTRRLSAGCAMWSCSPARVKLRSRATARK
jgi:hypothetical protein